MLNLGLNLSALGLLGGASGARTQLSNATIPDNTASGSAVGTLSASNGGTYTYSLVSNPGALFSIATTALKTASAIPAGSYPITIRATGAPAVPDQPFLITVTASSLDFSKSSNSEFLGTVIH